MVAYTDKEDKEWNEEERMWVPISKGYDSAELIAPLKTWD